MEMILPIITAILVSNSLQALIVWLLNRKRSKISDNNIIADTAEKIVKASSETIERLSTRITMAEREIIDLINSQKQCEDREKRLNKRLNGIESENQQLKLQIEQLKK